MTAPSNNERFIVPDLKEFLDRRLRDISYRINCHTIGTIKAFNPTNQTVTVSINYQRIIRGATPIPNSHLSSDLVMEYPLLLNVPIIFLQGGGSYLTFPIAAGDTCLVMFCDRDIDNWFQTGGKLPPNSDRAHDLNDAIAVVGLRSSQNPLASYNPNLPSLTDRTGERLLVSGIISPYGGASAPSGWLLCDGTSYSQTTYPDLFAVIGTTYGGGAGNFNVPDMRGRVAVGKDSGTFTPLGKTGGEETHVLTIPEIPAHHHTYLLTTRTADGAPGSGETQTQVPTDTSDTGGGLAHNNLQPYFVINYIIKA